MGTNDSVRTAENAVSARVHLCSGGEWEATRTASAYHPNVWGTVLRDELRDCPDDTVTAARAVTPEGYVIAEVQRSGALNVSDDSEDLPEWAADLGHATREQCEASAAAPGGLISVTEDGGVADEGSWTEQNCETVTVWVEWD